MMRRNIPRKKLQEYIYLQSFHRTGWGFFEISFHKLICMSLGEQWNILNKSGHEHWILGPSWLPSFGWLLHSPFSLGIGGVDPRTYSPTGSSTWRTHIFHVLGHLVWIVVLQIVWKWPRTWKMWVRHIEDPVGEYVLDPTSESSAPLACRQWHFTLF